MDNIVDKVLEMAAIPPDNYVKELPDNAVITEIEIAGTKIHIEPPAVVKKGDKIILEDLAC